MKMALTDLGFTFLCGKGLTLGAVKLDGDSHSCSLIYIGLKEIGFRLLMEIFEPGMKQEDDKDDLLF